VDILVLIGRILFSILFLMSGFGHITKREAMAPYAASKGVPAPALMVPLTGLMLLVGGLSVMLGCYARLGAWLLVLFLIPTAIIMHRFWGVSDPMQAQSDRVHFMKDISLAGAALMITYFGSGPFSLAP
jgi:putative oxidoreductase